MRRQRENEREKICFSPNQIKLFSRQLIVRLAEQSIFVFGALLIVRVSHNCSHWRSDNVRQTDHFTNELGRISIRLDHLTLFQLFVVKNVSTWVKWLVDLVLHLLFRLKEANYKQISC